MSSSGGGRNPGLTVFGKTDTWYYSLERLGYHCFILLKYIVGVSG